MPILIDPSRRVLVQGITGREGRARTKLMREFGTNVVAGVTPGKGGEDVEGVPVFDSVAEAVKAHGGHPHPQPLSRGERGEERSPHPGLLPGGVGVEKAPHPQPLSQGERGEGIDISVIFVPARLVKDAAVEAIEAGVKLLLLVPDRVPVWDVLEIAAVARDRGARFIGPNTLGVISPGAPGTPGIPGTPGTGAVIGMIGGRAASAREWFNGPIEGRTVGVISRSGGMTSSCGYYLSRRGIGLSTLVHVGGDSVVGLPIPDVALMFEDDEETDAIVVFGEIGGTQEERLAQLMMEGQVTKPVIAYIGGKAAKEGTRFSHAGAIIEHGRGTHEAKVSALREAGATVVEAFGDLPGAVVDVMGVGV